MPRNGFLVKTSLPFKEAELSRGLANNLAPVSKSNKLKLAMERGTQDVSLPLQTTRFKKMGNIKIIVNAPNFFSLPVTTEAQLPRFIEQWKDSTTDPDELEIVTGIKIPFCCVPFLLVPQATTAIPESVPILEHYAQDRLEMGAICQVPFSGNGFYNRLFEVSKKDGGKRPVIDLSTL